LRSWEDGRAEFDAVRGRFDQLPRALIFLGDGAYLWTGAYLVGRIDGNPFVVAFRTNETPDRRKVDAATLAALEAGVDCEGERLRAVAARQLRTGTRNAWLEIVLDEGRNRQIRRLLAAFDIGVLRLVRVAIGNLALGDLQSGRWRALSAAEARALAELRSCPARTPA
jgi:hypothetical protein